MKKLLFTGVSVTLLILSSCKSGPSPEEINAQNEATLKAELLEKGQHYINEQFKENRREHEKDLSLIDFSIDTFVYLSQGGIDKFLDALNNTGQGSMLSNIANRIIELEAKKEDCIREDGRLREKYDRQLIGWSETGKQIKENEDLTKQIELELTRLYQEQKELDQDYTSSENTLKDIMNSKEFCIDKDTIGYVAFYKFNIQDKDGSVQKLDQAFRNPIFFDLEKDIRTEWNKKLWDMMK